MATLEVTKPPAGYLNLQRIPVTAISIFQPDDNEALDTQMHLFY